jgi:hypothetical protein
MTFSLPQLETAAPAVGFREAFSASLAFSRANATRWIPIALLATAGDLLVALTTAGGIGIGGFLFSIWFVDLVRRQRGGESQFAARILPTTGAQILAALLGLLALAPAAAAIVFVMTRAFGDAIEDFVFGLNAPSAALSADLFTDPAVVVASIVAIAGLVLATYVSLRLSQTMFAAIAGDGPVASIRHSLAMTKGSLLLVLGWTIALSLIGLFVALVVSLLVALVAGPLGVTEGQAVAASSIIATGLYAPVSLGVFFTLFERLAARR